MAVVFSAVTVTANGDEAKLLVGGIPRAYEDLEGWTAFDNFMSEISEETEVAVHAEAYLYGEGEENIATPEEVAYFMRRMEMQSNFLTSRCRKMENADFTFTWSPEELFHMEVPK